MDGPLAAESRIEIAGLVCRFGAVPAINDVSFVVPAGAICGIAGPNGAGKSTLLRALAGAIGPAAGVVLVGGRAPQDTPADELARLVAVLPQRPVAPAGITAREAVGWGRHPHLARLSRPGSEDLRAIDVALASTATQHLADRPLDALSGGELHRVLIARALAQTPRILLLDEPTVHLDITHQVEVMELLRRLAAGGLTVVAALHDLNLTAAYCDLMALLAGGRLLAFGHPASVVRADLIAQAYGTAVSVRANPITGRPYLTLARAAAREATGPRVHVIGGGGTAAGLITRYAELGYRVSLGVVHVMDTDDETARALGLQVIEEAPFSPVGSDAAAAASEAAKTAAVVVIAPVPIGAGNLLNLEVAAAALANGVPVIMVAGIEARDFTGGEAVRRAAGLVAAGASVVPDLPAAIEAVRQLAPPPS